jgi:hypothetical protein
MTMVRRQGRFLLVTIPDSAAASRCIHDRLTGIAL